MRIVARSLLAVALVASLVGPVWAGGVDTTTLECGLFRDYTAPEPATSTPGSITFGVSGTPEVIAADATLVPPADTALPSLQGGAPTALTVVRNGGVITSLALLRAARSAAPPSWFPICLAQVRMGTSLRIACSFPLTRSPATMVLPR